MGGEPLIPVGKTAQGKVVSLGLRTILRHLAWTGASGWGKSTGAISWIQAIRQRAPNVGFVVLDPKGDIVPSLREMFVALHGTKLGIDPSRLISIEPFSGEYGVGLNILAPMHGLAPESQASVVTAIIASLSPDGLGQRGTGVLGWLARAIIPVGGNLRDVLRLLGDESARRGVAARSPDREVADYLVGEGGFASEPQSSISSLRSRLEWCLLLPAMKAALLAEGMVDGRRLLEAPMALVSLDGAPAGFANAARMLGGLLFQHLTAAVFSRPVGPDTHPVVIVIDEAHEVLRASGSGIIDDFSRLLTMARYKRCGLWVVTQSCSQLQSVGVDLVSLKNNLAVHAAFRPDTSDIRQLLPLMSLSGRQVDASRPDRLLAPAAEAKLRTAELSKMPPRVFILGDYVAGTLSRVRTLSIPFASFKAAADAAPPDLRDRYLRGAVGVPMGELLARAGRSAVPVAADKVSTEPGADPAPIGRRRPQRPALELP